MKIVKRREEKRREEKRKKEKRREEKRREEEKRRARNSGNLIQRLHRGRETSTSHDSTKQKGEKHPSAGEEQERNKEANNIKDVQGLKNQDHMC